MPLKHNIICSIGTLLFVAGGNQIEPLGLANIIGPQIAQVGEPFEITVGEAVVLKPGGLKIEFESVTADSRCPKGVLCIWEGMAEIQLRLTLARGEMTLLLLTIPGLVLTPYTSGKAVEQYGISSGCSNCLLIRCWSLPTDHLGVSVDIGRCCSWRRKVNQSSTYRFHKTLA